jgi:hypothetical protein
MLATISRTLVALTWLLVACSGKKDAAPAPSTTHGSAPATTGSSADPWASSGFQEASASGSSSGEASASGRSPADASKVAAFWKWFEANAETLRKRDDIQATMLTINGQLDKVDPSVFAEVGRDGDKLALVITADGDKSLFPVVEQIHAARPTVAGWTVVAFRQRDKSGFTIKMNGKEVKPSQVKFVGAPSGGKLDVELFIPGFTTTDEMGALGFILLDHAVGEYDMETRIGGIDFAPLSKAPANAKPLTQLPAMVDALK